MAFGAIAIRLFSGSLCGSQWRLEPQL